MITFEPCPLCKFSAKNELSENGKFKLVRCDDFGGCGDFIISIEAEKVLPRHVVKKALFEAELRKIDDGKMLLIKLKDNQPISETVDKKVWLDLKARE